MNQSFQKIVISSNPTKQGFWYFIPIVTTFWIVSFAFSGQIPNGLIVGFTAILLCILVIILVYKKDKNSKRTIEVSNEGLSETKKGVCTFIGWNESHQTYYNGTEFMYGGMFPIGTIVTTQVVTKEKRIRIDYPQVKFHEKILYLSSNNRLPLIKKQLEDGNRVYFGPIELDKDHLYLDNEQYQLFLIKNLKIENGKLILKLSGTWFSTKLLVRDIPNFPCLLTILSNE